jgi:hypothetical protein
MIAIISDMLHSQAQLQRLYKFARLEKTPVLREKIRHGIAIHNQELLRLGQHLAEVKASNDSQFGSVA